MQARKYSLDCSEQYLREETIDYSSLICLISMKYLSTQKRLLKNRRATVFFICWLFVEVRLDLESLSPFFSFIYILALFLTS